MSQGYIFPPMKITPKTLQKTADKLQPQANQGYLFQGNEQQVSRISFFILGGVGGVVASGGLVLMGVLINAVMTRIMPLLAREVGFVAIVQEVWVVLLCMLALIVMIILLLRMIVMSWREHQNESGIENTNLLLSDRSCPLGSTLQVSLHRNIHNLTYWKDVIRVYVRLRCLEITKNNLGTSVTYEHTPLWESKGQHYRVKPPARAIAADFSFRLPRADPLAPIAYQSPELLKVQDAETCIAWVVEIWQISEELNSHFLIPVTVTA